MDELAQGLFDFYSGQASAMLAVYEDINRLLGKTNDWTHPGTHCEVLLRNFIRKQLLAGMSADKGFVYGRVSGKEPSGHGPEIDILIHNTQEYRPVFRLDDFVIVQPEAVIGMIQVKRTLRTTPKNVVRTGIRNIAHAMQHLIDVQQQSRTARYGDKMPLHPTITNFQGPAVFTALVGFDCEIPKNPGEEIKTALLEQYEESQTWEYPTAELDTGVVTLPDFVGSLKGPCFITASAGLNQCEYLVYPPEHSDRNLSLQLLTWVITQRAFNFRHVKPPFAFPKIDQTELVRVTIPVTPRQQQVRPAPIGPQPPTETD